MIQASSVAKAFGLRPVLRGVDLTLGQGEFLALFGPNGAGKTTFLRILATLMRPTTGRIAIGGCTLPAQAATVRGLLGVVSHQPLLYGDLSAEENLRFYARMYGMPKDAAEARIAEVITAVGLHRRALDLVRTYSRGMQQRLAIARAILHDPPILLLDEPHTGLDQEAAATLDGVLREVALHGRTILMTTHDIARGLALAGSAAILSKGKIAYEAPCEGLDIVSFAETYTEVTGMAGVR
jgi:heme exporter protein A